MMRAVRFLFAAFLCAGAGTQALAQGTAGGADLLLYNAKIVTVDRNFALAEAIAIRAGKIVAVGTLQEAGKHAGPSTRRVDMKGRTVTPRSRSPCGANEGRRRRRSAFEMLMRLDV